MKRTLTAALLALLVPFLAQAATVVAWDVNTDVSGSGVLATINTDTGLDTGTPLITSATTGYEGEPVYAAFNEGPGQTLLNVNDSSGGGLRVRHNLSGNTGDIADGLFLFETDSVRFKTGNDTLNASSIVINNPSDLSTATLSFVIQDGGSFYISDPSADFAGGTSPFSYTANALSLSWFNYDPSTAAGVSLVGTLASPTFGDIDFIGFTLSSTKIAGAAVNFGVREFSAEALPAAPEPGSVAMLGVGALIMSALRQKKRRPVL